MTNNIRNAATAVRAIADAQDITLSDSQTEAMGSTIMNAIIGSSDRAADGAAAAAGYAEGIGIMLTPQQSRDLAEAVIAAPMA